MPDKPIIFSGPMVRALLDGRKTQTRRVLKPQPAPASPIGGADFVVMPGEPGSWCWLNGWDGSIIDRFRVTYAPGDRLYVSENWRACRSLDRLSPSDIRAQCLEAGYRRAWAPILYEADGATVNFEGDTQPGRFRSPRHMLREFSRLTLTVTDVRVQRLQEISEEDAEAEGFGGHFPHEVMPQFFPDAEAAGHMTIPECFARLWSSLHGPDAWAANPWVAAISFTVERRSIDEVPHA